MTRFKIILPELSKFWKNINDRIGKTYGYLEYNDKCIKIKGVIKREYDRIEGSGQIEIGNIIYFGSWNEGEVSVSSFVSDLLTIVDKEVIFAGVNWEKKTIASNLSIDTHFILTEESLNKMDKYIFYIPVVQGAKLYMEMMDGTNFDIEINNSKPQDKFLLTSNFAVSKLTHGLVCSDGDVLFMLTIIITKDKVKYERKNIIGEEGNYIFDYSFKKSAIDFLETTLFRIPSKPKSKSELQRYLF